MSLQKPRELLDADKTNIIKTNYGLKKIPVCFGFMDIKNPFKIEAGMYTTPDEMHLVKRHFTQSIRDLVDQADMCQTCHMFDRCVGVTHINILREK